MSGSGRIHHGPLTPHRDGRQWLGVAVPACSVCGNDARLSAPGATAAAEHATSPERHEFFVASPNRRPSTSSDEALGLVAHATRDVARGLVGDMSGGILDGVLHALRELGVATAQDDERRQPRVATMISSFISTPLLCDGGAPLCPSAPRGQNRAAFSAGNDRS